MAVTGTVAGVVAAGASAASAAKNIISKPKGSGATSSDPNAAGQAAFDYRDKAAGLWDNLQTPVFNTTPYTGQSWLQDLQPQTYNPVTSAASGGYDVTQMQDSPEMRANEVQALQQLQQWAKGGLTPEDMASLNQIAGREAAAGTSQGATAANALAARGLNGSGAQYAAQLMANQGAADNSNTLYSDAMKAALARQLTAVTGAGQAANSIRGQDASISKQMADLNNTWNQNVNNMRTNAAQNNANTLNSAQQFNLTGRQGVANQNVANSNTNIDHANNLMQSNFQNQQAKITGQSNAYNGLATLAGQQQAADAARQTGDNQMLSSSLGTLGKLFTSFPSTSGSGGNYIGDGLQDVGQRFAGTGFGDAASNAGYALDGNEGKIGSLGDFGFTSLSGNYA